MDWNYRIIKYTAGGYGLHEVYYHEDGTVQAWTSEPVGFVADEGEAAISIAQSLAMALSDVLRLLVLEESGLPDAPAEAR